MAGIAELTHPVACECNGVLYLMGYRDGAQHVRRSADRGQTWIPFQDESIERVVSGAAAAQRAALVKLDSQGRALLAAVVEGATIRIYVSEDDGDSWRCEGEL